MRFSQAHQPRYAVYVVRETGHILVARYTTLARALTQLALEVEAGEMAYHDVNR
jgi:hypothetical protein